MATPGSTDRGQQGATTARAQAPIRWPKPDRRTLGLLAVWAAGLLVALVVPAAFVSPTAKNPPTGDVLAALGCTVLGAFLMIGVSMVLWRRTKDSSLLVMGLIPGIACIAGGIMLSAAKIGAI